MEDLFKPKVISKVIVISVAHIENYIYYWCIYRKLYRSCICFANNSFILCLQLSCHHASIDVLPKVLNDKPVGEDDLTMILGKNASLVEKVEDTTVVLQNEIKKTKKQEKEDSGDKDKGSMKRPAANKRPAAAESSEEEDDEDEEDEDDSD